MRRHKDGIATKYAMALMVSLSVCVREVVVGQECNGMNCAGGDIPWANPLKGFRGTIGDCEDSCNRTQQCIGWVYQGPDAGDGCLVPNCWLKAANKNDCKPLNCTCQGNRPPPPPAPPCTECVQTREWLGAEWHPANASNSLWMSPAFFDGYMDESVAPQLVDTAKLGLTAIRVFLHNMAYEANAAQFVRNLDRFLSAASKAGLGVGFVFFDDCWNHAGASTTVQCRPQPGIHNGCSMACPQDIERTNTSRFKPYIKDIIGAFANDSRVIWWGMFNEPNKRSNFSLELRSSAYVWATSLKPRQPVLSCWDRMTEPTNTDSELQNIHYYNTNFQRLTQQSLQGLSFNPRQGSLVTEAGCRWFQGEQQSSGSPLEFLNWAKVMNASKQPYQPGLMLSWTVFVGNDNTRWHWGSALNTPEPAIPWCGLMWPDGWPVSYSEASAITAYTGKPDFIQPLLVKTFLPSTMEEIENGGASRYLSVSAGTTTGFLTPMNATANFSNDVLFEMTLWPDWTKASTTHAAVGMVVQSTKIGKLFAGVTRDGLVVLERWNTPIERIATFNLSSLPSNQNHVAVNGWNMLRLHLSTTGDAYVWWNPTHADTSGYLRGMRLNSTITSPSTSNVSSILSLATALRGGVSTRVDYFGIFDPGKGIANVPF